MINIDKNLSKIVEYSRDYLSGKMSPDKLGKIIDDMVSSGLLSDLDKKSSDLVDQLQIDFALYISDENTRKEEPLIYIIPSELFCRVKIFEEKMSSMGY